MESMSPWAESIYRQKYSLNGQETWPETVARVVNNVMAAIPSTASEKQLVEQFIRERKFIPGGRYLYASGRGLKAVNNCLLLRAEDSREGWADLLHKAGMALMTGAGIGIDYSAVRGRGSPISRTGGVASGPLSLMQMINEVGRHVRQGGSRRSAIWAGLAWDHPDVFDFIQMKNWPEEVRALKEKDFSFPGTMDMTNVSVILNRRFFRAFEDPAHPNHIQAHDVYWQTVRRMTKTAEPGFSIDYEDEEESLRNAPVAGNTMVLTRRGYQPVKDIVGKPKVVWTGEQWAKDVIFRETNPQASLIRVTMTGGRVIECDPSHPFLVNRYKGWGRQRRLVATERVAAKSLVVGDILKVALPQSVPTNFDVDAYSLGYAYGDGTISRTGKIEITFCTEESKKALTMVRKATNFSSLTDPDKRGFARIFFKTDPTLAGASKSVFPATVYEQTTDYITSFIAGLFDADGNWEPFHGCTRLASKHRSFLQGVARLLEQIGILTGVSKAGTSTYGKSQGWQLVVMADYRDIFKQVIPTQRLMPTERGLGYRKSVIKVTSIEEAGIAPVYCANVGVPEHSFQAEGIIISNCCELVSADDSDICNLGSINLARVNSVDEMAAITRAATQFLLAGTVYSDVPYQKVAQVREKNRRLGLGLMGVHEWLLMRGKRYGPDDELAGLLDEYALSTKYAHQYADEYSLSRPVKTRAVAPTGTIGIIGETTTGIEPVFCSAFKRRYLAGGSDWRYQYVVDPTARRLLKMGIDVVKIEDAYMLARDVERRVSFQHWVQKWVDHAISSTINLPAPLEKDESVEFGKMLYPYLPGLRGLTCYPDGARGGQPLVAVDIMTAMEQEGVVFEENEESCVGGVCGS